MPCIILPIKKNQILAPVRVLPAGALRDPAGIQDDAKSIYALVDTGAACTCISDYWAKQLGLSASEEIDIMSAHGVKGCDLYYADLLIEGLGRGWMECNMVEFVAGEHSSHHVILGMDILSQGTLHTTWDKEAVFCV